MPAVLIQVELPGAKRAEYDSLAELMSRAGWRSRLSGDLGKAYPLAAGTYFGTHEDIGKLASGLRMKIRDAGLHTRPVVFTAVLEDWTIVGE